MRCSLSFFFDRRPVPFGGSRCIETYDRGPVPGGNRSAASCLCTVLRRALYHYSTRSPPMRCSLSTAAKVTDALVRILRRFLTPVTILVDGLHDQYFREGLLETAGHGDGHVLAVAIALLLAILTGRSDLCIGVFGAGKTRSSRYCSLPSAANSKTFLQWCLRRRMLLQKL